MKILVAHNRYQEQGGEDAVFLSEIGLLREFGQDVFSHERTNAEINGVPKFKQLQILWEMDWSKKSYAEISGLIKKFRPDVVHFHNIFFMLTPSVYQACRDCGVAVVQSQHNFRLICSNALFFRDNHVCEDCLNKNFWQAIFHRCYKKSFLLSAFVARMIARHWEQGTWTNLVDQYIVASEFTRHKYSEAGIPEEKISVKSNFVYPDPKDSPAAEKHPSPDGKYALYIGRLSEEKGVFTLLEAWKMLKAVPLKIVGDGPLLGKIKSEIAHSRLDSVELLGKVSQGELDGILKNASFLVVPSRCYESFPRVVAEAFACGVPVVASCLGSLGMLIEEKKNGLLFNAGDASDLAAQVTWLSEHPSERHTMSVQSRREYEHKFTLKKNFERLMEIYALAIDSRKTAVRT